MRLRKYSHIKCKEDVISIVLPKDGQADPANIALALARHPRTWVYKFLKTLEVEDVIINDDHAKGVQYSLENGETETIFPDVVVNCGGMWAEGED